MSEPNEVENDVRRWYLQHDHSPEEPCTLENCRVLRRREESRKKRIASAIVRSGKA